MITKFRSQHNNIRTIDEDTFCLPISTFSALGVFHVMRYINVRYLLTYLLTYFCCLLADMVRYRGVSVVKCTLVLCALLHY